MSTHEEEVVRLGSTPVPTELPRRRQYVVLILFLILEVNDQERCPTPPSNRYEHRIHESTGSTLRTYRGKRSSRPWSRRQRICRQRRRRRGKARSDDQRRVLYRGWNRRYCGKVCEEEPVDCGEVSRFVCPSSQSSLDGPEFFPWTGYGLKI